MQFALILSLVASALAMPASGPPPTDGQCIKFIPGPEPGSWAALSCPGFTIAPGSDCKEVPGKEGAAYPECVS